MALAGRALADPPDLPDPAAGAHVSDDGSLDDLGDDLGDERGDDLDDDLDDQAARGAVDTGATLADDAAEESARSAIDAGATLAEDSLAATSGLVDVASLHDLAARHHRPSRWGRIDLTIAWRRVDRIDRDTSEPSRRDEVWLVATWRN